MSQLVLPVPRTRLSPRVLHQEAVLVLLAGLGASAIYSVLSIIRKTVDTTPLNQQTTAMNTSKAEQPWLDLAFQLVEISLGLVTVALALHLLAREMQRPAHFLGFDLRKPGPDLALGALLAAVIGIPGIGLYLVARSMGLNTQIAAADLGTYWWALPVLVLAACQNAILEEVVMIGYLFTRWTQAGWSLVTVVVVSALVRGTYHLYQGFGGFVGNVVMGLLLGAVYARTRRVMPLVVAHAVLDIVAFVGYALLRDQVSWL
ncbi:CPBP family intramembrane glutamic endopeptidase [Demetria terragena]|uniref:CPBP family intramembrane glutamic endopeptidase n=1 Tax=Demetria terragena TaxID=63959 RepID=UPI00037B7796|nr:CPBP family intramembrane glutamic endopeptidase [Demetria terragena]